ncbi:MAG: hypothetical protein EXS03_06175 [Phycisphaerales bacterium]|nr:hypothetical protein [Phycisphaerales bacterium]
MHLCVLPIAACLGCAAVAADSYDFTLQSASTATQSMTVQYPLAGTFIGNYDAAANPTGTRTLPGFFGGSGNNAIPYTSTSRTSNAINSHPAGTFTLALVAPGACQVTGFACDLVNGFPGTVTSDLILTYSTFHTVAPSSIYPSLGPVTIPVGSGTITAAIAVQAGPALGTATPSGSGTVTVAVAIPVLVSVTGSVGGQPLPPDPTPAIFTLTGTLTPRGSTASLTSTVHSSEPIGPLPPPPPLVNMPVALPTIPPGTLTANLLFSGTFSDGSGSSTLDLSLVASGVPSPIMGDVNGDGTVDGMDLTALFSAWGTSSASADINGDGTVDGLDLTALFSNWSV